MNKRLTILLSVAALVLFITSMSFAQEDKEFKWPEKKFETVGEELYRTPVLSQGSTGTCWSFSTVSLLESEFHRIYGGEIDLSEIFNARQTYLDKADYYVRMHGNNTFSQGAFSHDVLNVMKKYGAVPVEVMDGLWDYEERHNHGELQRVLTGFIEGIGKAGWRAKPTRKWRPAFEKILDVYLGEYPEKFMYEGKEYTPRTFMDEVVKLNPDDYVEITSYQYMPYYTTSEHIIPDNWVHYDDFYNLPLDDFMKVYHHALENGYSVAISADVSEEGFRMKDGYAILKDDIDGVDVITADQREEMWNEWNTTDDHGMHAVGIAKDENGDPFYLVKNSWGTDSERTGPYNGHLYMSDNYLRAKMHTYVIHKDAIPADIREKLKIK